MSQHYLGFSENVFSFFPVIKKLANFCKDKRSSCKILFNHAYTIDKNLILNNKNKNKNLKTFLSIWRENGVKYSYILWNLQTLRMNSKWSILFRRNFYAVGQWVVW